MEEGYRCTPSPMRLKSGSLKGSKPEQATGAATPASYSPPKLGGGVQ